MKAIFIGLLALTLFGCGEKKADPALDMASQKILRDKDAELEKARSRIATLEANLDDFYNRAEKLKQTLVTMLEKEAELQKSNESYRKTAELIINTLTARVLALENEKKPGTGLPPGMKSTAKPAEQPIEVRE